MKKKRKGIGRRGEEKREERNKEVSRGRKREGEQRERREEVGVSRSNRVIIIQAENSM